VLEDGAWYTPLRRTASRRYLDIELMLHDYQIVKFLELFGTEAWSILQPETNGRRVSKKERKKRVASIAIKARKGRLATGKKSVSKSIGV
jgi:hypothetical protein